MRLSRPWGGRWPWTLSLTRAVRTTQRWVGELLLAGGWAHYRGHAGDTAFHSHYPTQIVFSQATDVRVTLVSGRVLRGPHIVVPSKVAHRLVSSDAPVDIIYVEPTLIDADTEGFTCARSWVDYLAEAHAHPSDARLGRALSTVDKMLGGKIPLAVVARSAGMSKSLFTRKFRATTGMPLRRYVLWRRLHRAVVQLASGDSLTAAAAFAGFSDSAHFSRTMRKTFGMTASAALQAIRFVTF